MRKQPILTPRPDADHELTSARHRPHCYVSILDTLYHSGMILNNHSHIIGLVVDNTTRHCGHCGISTPSHKTLAHTPTQTIDLSKLPGLPQTDAKDFSSTGDQPDQALDNFILRLYLYDDWLKQVISGDSQPSERLTKALTNALMHFHSRHKYLLMAHCYNSYRELGKLVAETGRLAARGSNHEAPPSRHLATYIQKFSHALTAGNRRSSHTNALTHIYGYLKNSLDAVTRQKILAEIDAYQRGDLPLEEPINMLRYYIHDYGSGYIKQQSYLWPGPFRSTLLEVLKQHAQTTPLENLTA